MTPALCRVLFACLSLPMAAVAYVVIWVGFVSANRSRGVENSAWLVAGSVTWAMLAIAWWLIWRRAVAWTPRRRYGTWLAALVALAVGGLVGLACAPIDDDLPYAVGSAIAPLAWVGLAIVAWRETDAEREQRQGSNRSRPLPCPACGYDLTGLRGTRCPECGVEFTLDALLAVRRPMAADVP